MKYCAYLTGILLLCSIASAAAIRPVKLTCEYLENPAVVDVLRPRLSWINVAADGERGQEQAAWQVRVAGSREKLEYPDLWDSGKRVSGSSLRIRYEGKPLKSRQQCWWQVRVWDRDGNVSGWSEPGFWRMGLLREDDWKAKWIGAPWQGEEPLPKPEGGPDARPDTFGPPAPLLRKEFSVEKEVDRAVVFVTGPGYFELYLNGSKVGEDVLVPNQTNYGKRPQLPEAPIPLEDDFRGYRVMYLAYDVKKMLRQGENVIGGIAGNGFYNPAKFWAAGYGSPRFLCQLHITYTDGTGSVVVSDGSWKAAKSPILMDMVYYGEVYDARKEQPGWCTVPFDDSQWEPVALRDPPGAELVAHTAHPDRVMERLSPVSVNRLDSGRYVVDFGEEISGWVRLNRVDGPPGHRIRIRFNSNEYSGDNTYICSGNGAESYAPRFNWFVFSGVEIINWPGELHPEDLTAEAVYTFVETSATFETSNPLYNEINTIWRRSQTDNMHGGIASDCPHRERSPYTGDGQVASITVMHNYDARNFYHKWVQDMLDAQIVRTGYVPNGAPWQPGCGGGPAWGAAICIIPWHFYVHYGSLDMLEKSYEGMKGYLRYMLTWTDEEGIMHSRRAGRDGEPLKWFNLGEWSAPGETVPDAMVHTFYLWYCAAITAGTADILGPEAEASRYAALAESTRQAFHARFYDAERGTYGNGGGNILALRMGVPEDRYDRVVASLRENIRANRGHLDTGIFGTRFFFEVLSENGMHDLACEAMNKITEPGYGRWIELGSTTTRERWDESGSHNHPMFGGGLVWFYRNLAGMQADPEQPGYRHIIFKPAPSSLAEKVAYIRDTPYGKGGISWKVREGSFHMEVTVPVSCSATVYVPARDPGDVSEGGMMASEIPGISFVRMEDGYAVFSVGSGKYDFGSARN